MKQDTESYAKFSAMILTTCRVYNAPPLDAQVIRAYFDELQFWSLEQIAEAVRRHGSDTMRGHRLPSAIDLRRILSQQPPEAVTQLPRLPSWGRVLNSPPQFPAGYLFSLVLQHRKLISGKFDDRDPARNEGEGEGDYAERLALLPHNLAKGLALRDKTLRDEERRHKSRIPLPRTNPWGDA